MQFLSRLMPREQRFFELFDHHAELVVAASAVLTDLLRNFSGNLEWRVQLLAAFLPGVPLHDVEYIDEFGGAALREDEDCFCALIPAR